ncbi:MAG: hypothetical protein J6V94_06965 [Lachnospiraceae bacterium]|jgi:hypothetical protein|nr:hypothetical protein [Lachnospiraceae bacterium]MBQ7635862.1 hypothetical protein [Lachnospiraceae bacterium]
MSEVISINLDPLKDGIIGTVERAESTAGKYVIIGTNYEHRVISEAVFETYTDEMAKKDILGCIIVADYMLFYDTTKLIKVDGENYLIGSFLLVKISQTGNSAYVWLSEDDIEEAKEDLYGYFAELIINGERYDALCVG